MMTGKSTLIKIIAGVLRPGPEGRIVIGSGSYRKRTRRRAARKWVEDLAIKTPDPDNAVKTLRRLIRKRVRHVSDTEPRLIREGWR